MTLPDVFVIDVPEQGVCMTLTKGEVLGFFANEQKYYREFEQILQNDLNIGNQSAGSTQGMYQKAISEHNKIIDGINKDNPSLFDQYIDSAKSNEALIGQSKYGEYIRGLPKEQAQWCLALNCTKWINNNKYLTFAINVARHTRAAASGLDLSASKIARDTANESLANSKRSSNELASFIADKEKLIGDLELLYREKLTIEEPANYWQTVANQKTRHWQIWLGVFALMIMAALAGIFLNWDHLTKSITSLTTGANGTIALGGVALVSAPALLYAWLLRNISRLFIQNLSLADDASHRKGLATTYLGLVANANSKVTSEDRALVLNALFRPAPTNPADDGPPSGLIELVAGKSKS